MATGRSSRVKMRSRPIDVNKALAICDTSQREPDDLEIEQALAAIPGGNHGHGHGHAGHTGQGDGMIAGVGIPTPPIFVDVDYHKRFDYGKFIQPSYYIKAHQTAGTGLINHLDRYDLLKEDIEWLAQYNASAEAKRPPAPTMSEDDMERMIDLFEKEAGKITTCGMRAEMMSIEDKIDPRKEFPLVRAIVVAATVLHVRTKILEPVYEYWIHKRLRLGKALMRQYQEPPPRGDTSPHVAFRLRTEGRRISKRNPRKDDHSGYYKMGYLKKDFAKVMDIIENVQTREQLKREACLLNIHIFDAKLQATPWAQKLLKEKPVVQQAIAIQLAVPPPPSSMAGAPALPLPPVILNASAAEQRTFQLLHSVQPPCSYSRQELEAEGRRRRAQNLQVRTHMPPPSTGQKRPHTVAPPRRPSHGQGGGSSEQRRAEKEARKAARREYALSFGSLPPLEEEPEELEPTDEEDLLSEDEEDQKFYDQIEAHVKRMKIQKEMAAAQPNDPHALALAQQSIVKVEPLGAYATYSPYPTSLTPTATPTPSSHYTDGRPRVIPPGGKVGYISGVVGRGNLLWIDATAHLTPKQQATYQHAAHQQHLQHLYHQQQAHAHAAHAHAHASAGSGHHHATSGGAPMQINVHPPAASAHAASAAPMEVDQRGGTTMPPHSTAIRV